MTLLRMKIYGSEEIQKALKRFPVKAATLFYRAINAGLAEIHKESDDHNFLFKRPTGTTKNSFAHGISLATRDKLLGKIGPTTKYAIYVHEGTRRGIKPNRFMNRIAKQSEKSVMKHFDNALSELVNDMSK